MSRLCLGLSVALALSAVWLPAVAQTPPTDTYDTFRERFNGTWRLSTPLARGRQVIERAVEQTVSAMNFFTRPIARPMLRDATPLNRAIHLRFVGDGRLSVQFDDQETYVTRIGRTSTRYRTSGGDPMRVTQRFRDNGQLEQVFQADDGTRWYVWTLQPDGHARLDSTTNGEMMPQPMHYTLEYQR